ncbi:MAG: hypothetical protein U9O98_00105 [Asgard group archaeon]|nr:hypothetical protein [Asgard group archaeon]
MLNHKGRIIEFSLTNQYYEKQEDNSYEMHTNTIEFNTFAYIESDMENYVKVEDILIDGKSENDEYTIKLEDMLNELRSDSYSGDDFNAFIALSTTLIAFGGVLLALSAAYSTIAASYEGVYLIWIGWTYIAASTMAEICLWLGIGYVVIDFIALYSILFIVISAQ